MSHHAWADGKHWCAWFRVFGYGLVLSTVPPLFSERNGYTRALRVFGVRVGVLRPGKLRGAQ